MFRATGLAFVLCALQACSSATHDSNPASTTEPFPQAAAQDLQQTLDDVVAADIAPGVSVEVLRPGYAAWLGAAGVADRDTGEALTPSARFRAGSILKVAVATAVMQLVETERLSLDEKLIQLLPDGVAARVPNARDITLSMLLDHTSGIADFDDAAFDANLPTQPTRRWSTDELLEMALSHAPVAAPGAGWSYSNTDYVLLGEVLRRTTGKPWRQVVSENVFAAAGLTHSALPNDGNSLCVGCSRGYEAVEGELVDITEVDPSMAGPAGGAAWITTTDDLTKLIGALATGKLFQNEATLELMLDFVDASVPAEAQTGYGLGITRFQVGDVELVGHLGGTAGFQSFVFFQPGNGTIVSGYMNRGGDFGAFVLPVLDAVGRAEAAPSGG